ncbi:phytanoyl-CoA dioxygenase family protein [Streptosporangium saharense]|uniref:Ectoine hydroxylase-related dioxygenase (Phytanoyl-CoA dioxygenase family) n=1 Tax=Streptosporangium saharense TaxID=1706840 RepID=A0A7W7QIL3_9ACTN|nr:phytanoyl-CoA dioxygenase family protein [Streptosporangium saharense]MBB4914275.1 ectoine hydroxylase-related dioxygenase (phytanoyl-CoA dioxygenase family) [Streptosporangium saharense]
MPDLVSDEVVEHYRQEGFIRIPGVLTPQEVKSLLEVSLLRLDEAEKVNWDREDGRVMDWVPHVDRASEELRGLALHPRITAIAERLAGVPLRLFKSELLRKGTAGSALTPLHADAPAIPFSGRPVGLTAWVALTDVPVERGCMSYIPGSHLVPHEQDEARERDPFRCPSNLVWEPRVTVPVRAGDVTFHHERVLHLAGRNDTDEVRVSLATVYMDAESVYEPSDLVPDDLGGLLPGQRLDDDHVFPLIGARG